MLLVLICIGPPRLYILSRLITSPPSVDGTVNKRLHTLPTVTFDLSVPDLSAWLEVPGYTHTLLQAIFTSMMGQQ